MRVLSGPAELLETIRPLARDREAELNLMVGIASRGLPRRIQRRIDPIVLRDPSCSALPRAAEATCAVLEEGSRLRAAVLCEAPFNIVLATWDAEAAEAMAAALVGAGMLGEAPGVVGSVPSVSRFARAFAGAAGRSAQRTMGQRILKLTEVIPPPAPPPGGLRLATEADAEPLAPWFGGFAEVMGESIGSEESLARARARIRSGLLFVWETEHPVSMAALARPGWTGIGVTAVYTPPEARGRGYASACVAALSQRALDAGRAFCVLYTDASNPTSNRLYERIGYRFVCDSEEWRFETL